MTKVFLSYARADAGRAQQLAEAMTAGGYEVWWDRHIQGGSRFAKVIDEALKSASAVVVLWSESSVESAWVQDEAAEGRDTGRLVPVVLDAVRPPLGFRQFQSVDLSTWDGTGPPNDLDNLLHAIKQTGTAKHVDRAPVSLEPVAAKRTIDASICVLPFVNMSGDPEQEYFSDGISEDIITDLSKVSALSVVARNTAFTFKGQSHHVKEIARQLGVTHVLEGSVRKAGSRVRITAQLIDGKAGDHLWAERYDRDLTDIFAIQDELSRAIVDALQVKLLPEEKKAFAARGTENVDAYNLYLMARQQWIGGTYGDSRRDETIVRICREATNLDAGYAEAWALMALAQSELRFWHAREENALPAAERALSLNPDLAEAQCVKARYLEDEGRYEKANTAVERALALCPESWEVNREAARMLFRQGRMREAVSFFERAASMMDTDYHSPAMLVTCYTSLGEELKRQEFARLSLERAERAVAQNPTDGSALAVGASALALLGEQQRAKDWIRRGLLLDPDNLAVRYNLGCALVMELQDPEAALDVLQPFFQQLTSTTIVRHLEADPDLDSIRHTPRFLEMLAQTKARLGLKG